jgi:secreted trypsin-like serine protease
VILAVVVAATSAAVPSAIALGRGAAHVAVVGGQPAEPGMFPWTAYILDVNGNTVGQCSGTVVAPNLVLTAGHCAENMKTGVLNAASGYRVLTGNVNAAAPEAEKQVSGVTRVIVCPCFDRRTTVGDVALLELSTPTTAPAVTLAPSPREGTAAVIAGWGDTYYEQDTQVEQLRWAPTVVQGSTWCEREASPFSSASEICTIDPPRRQTGACSGDSGGPLLVAEPSAVGGMVQIGVASHVYDGCSTSRPSVFTRVDAISAWVGGWIQALGPGAPASSAVPPGIVASPVLAGIASSQSVAIRGDTLSLVVGCDSEAGTCSGAVEAMITVRERLIERRDDGRQVVVFARTRKVTLASAAFAIAPGSSAVIHSSLSSQNRTLLFSLHSEPFDVLLAGRGFSRCVVRLSDSTEKTSLNDT